MSPSAKASPKLPKLWDPARPDLKVQWERFSRIFREIAPLTRVNWDESGMLTDRLDFDPDWDRYLEFERAGILHILTARKSGKLIGYVVALLHPHIEHASVPCATIKTVWLAKEERSGTLGIRLLKQAFRGLENSGARIFMVADKGHKNGALGRILRGMGFAKDETIYAKVIPT